MDDAIWIVRKRTHTNSRTIEICDGAYTVMDDAIWNRLQTYALPLPGQSKSRIRAKILLTLTRTMPLFEIVCKCTYDPTPGPSQFMIIAEMVLILSWTMLFEIVSKSMHDPLPEPKSYDCSWDRPYIVMNDAIRNRLQRYAWPTPGASAPVSIAKTMLTLSWTMVMKSIAKVHMA